MYQEPGESYENYERRRVREDRIIRATQAPGESVGSSDSSGSCLLVVFGIAATILLVGNVYNWALGPILLTVAAGIAVIIAVNVGFVVLQKIVSWGGWKLKALILLLLLGALFVICANGGIRFA